MTGRHPVKKSVAMTRNFILIELQTSWPKNGRYHPAKLPVAHGHEKDRFPARQLQSACAQDRCLQSHLQSICAQLQ
jgi:hypothetical protein